jgi:hypothetical protein
MSTTSIGDILYRLVSASRNLLFRQGELTQLTYTAFDVVVKNLNNFSGETIELSYPVGLRPDRTAISSVWKYGKDDLLRRYHYLAFQQLPLNGLVQIVIIVEALLGDIVRAVVIKYPQKLGAKRSVPLQVVLEAKTIEDVHLRATDALLNDLSYKSPSEFAQLVEPLLSLNLLECPAFHRYVEVKAARDIYIHNRGIVNETYLRKAGSHVRARADQLLPVDIQYFLESYEHCLQLTEWLEGELDERWPSSEREQAQARAAANPEPGPSEPAVPLNPVPALDPTDESSHPDAEVGVLNMNQEKPAKRRRKTSSKRGGAA